MDFKALKVEISKADYAGMDDQKIVDAITAKTIPQVGSVGTQAILFWCAKTDAIRKLQKASTIDGEVGSIATASLALLTTGVDINFSTTEVQDMFKVLVDAEIFTQDEANALIGLGVTLISRADQLGLQGVGVGDVQYGRKL